MSKAEAGTKLGVSESYDIIIGGTVVASTVPSSALTATHARTFYVLVQCDPNSAQNAVVGNAYAQWIVLRPGESIEIAISDPVKVFVRAAAATTTVNWMALA